MHGHMNIRVLGGPAATGRLF